MSRIPPFLKWLASSVIALALFTGLFFVRGQSGTQVVAPTETPTVQDIRSLFVILTDDDNKVARTSLIFTSKNRDSVTALSFDPRIAVDLGERGVMPIRDAIPQADPSGVDTAVENASGVRIDGAFLMQRLALAGLIDSVGGITVNSPNTYRVTPQDDVALYVRKGKSQIDGTRAAGYALISDAAYLQVLVQTFAQLPSDGQRIDEIMGALGSLARSTIPTSDISQMIVQMGKGEAWSDLSTIDVPTAASYLELAGKSDWRRVSLGWRAGALALTPDPDHPRIAVRSDFPQDRLRVRDALLKSGYIFIDGGNGKMPKRTQLRVPAKPTKEFVSDLSQALDLKTLQVVIDPTVESTDAVIVTGVDYR